MSFLKSRIPIPIWGKAFNTAPATLTTQPKATATTTAKEVKPKHKSLKTSISKGKNYFSIFKKNNF
jgi:hypothetical protein